VARVCAPPSRDGRIRPQPSRDGRIRAPPSRDGDPMIAAFLALAASVCWGVGDVLAGLAGRRSSTWTVSLVSLGSSLVLGVVLLAALGYRLPTWEAAWPALAAGVAVSVATVAYFEALAVGTMSLVAPIASSCAVIPVAVGLVRGEQPSLIQAVGVVAALVGVGLAVYDRHPEAGVVGTIEVGVAVDLPVEKPRRGSPRSRPAYRPRLAAVLAVGAAMLFGASLVGYAETAAHDPLLPPVAGRFTSVAILLVLVGALRLRARRTVSVGSGVTGVATSDHPVPGFWLPKDVLPQVLVAGVFHLAAATLFSLASTRGLLSLVSVLSSLGAVVTMGLAYFLIRERLEPQQVVGVVLALLGVVAIAGG